MRTSSDALRILFVTTTYPLKQGDSTPGFVADLARHLVREQGMEVRVLAPHRGGAAKFEVVDGVRVERFQYALNPYRQCLAYGGGIPDNLKNIPGAKWQVPGLFAAMGGAVHGALGRCDIVHAHWAEPAFIAAMANAGHRKPMVVSVHSLKPRPGWVGRGMHRWVLGRADRVLFNSRYTQSEAAAKGYGCRGQVIYQGYDEGMFGRRGPSSRSRWRERLGVGSEAKLIVAVGRMIRVKGMEVLARAADEILHDRNEWHIVMAGDGPGRVGIERILSGSLRQSRVHLTGALGREDLADLLAAGDLFVNPGIIDEGGRAEGLGLTTIEAMASGLAAVGSRCGGISETIVDGVTGVLVGPGDGGALVGGVRRLMDDEFRRASMGEAAREMARNRFTWPRLAAEVAEVYREMM